MDNVNSFFDELGQGISDGLNVAKLAKVVKYYPENMKRSTTISSGFKG